VRGHDRCVVGCERRILEPDDHHPSCLHIDDSGRHHDYRRDQHGGGPDYHDDSGGADINVHVDPNDHHLYLGPVDDAATYKLVRRVDYDNLVAAFDKYDERYAVYDVDYDIVRAAHNLIDRVNDDHDDEPAADDNDPRFYDDDKWADQHVIDLNDAP
jgi:hypothetical protein